MVVVKFRERPESDPYLQYLELKITYVTPGIISHSKGMQPVFFIPAFIAIELSILLSPQEQGLLQRPDTRRPVLPVTMKNSSSVTYLLQGSMYMMSS